MLVNVVEAFGPGQHNQGMKKDIPSMLSLVLLLSLSVAQAQEKDDCRFIRLDQSGPWGRPGPNKDASRWSGSMQKVPVTNQGALGICYSNAAVQMVDAYRFSQSGPLGDNQYNHLTSPLVASLGTRSQDNVLERFRRKIFVGNHIEGGGICEVVRYVRDHGSCQNSYKLEELGDTIVPLLRILKKESELHSKEVDDETKKLYSEVQEEWNTLDKKNSIDGAVQLLTKSCPIITVNPKLKCLSERVNTYQGKQSMGKHAGPERKGNIKKVLDGLLNGPSPVQPIGISYCSSFLKQDRDYKGRECRPHASLIIGRRKNPTSGSCEYLIRNSWGQSCERVLFDKTKEHYFTKPLYPAFECDEGNIWVGIDILRSKIFGVEHLQ